MQNSFFEENKSEIMSTLTIYLFENICASINFKQYEKDQKDIPAQSEVLKYMLEQESQVGGVAGLPEFQEDRRSNFI